VDSRVESGLHVRLELIYELPESFKKVVVSHRFEPKFQLHASQLFPHSTFVDAVTGCIVIQRCRTLETMDFAMKNYAPGNQVGSNRIPNTRRSAFVASNSSLWICILCANAGHSISYCQNSKTLSPSRSERLGLCITFHKVGHQVRQCNSSSCRACGSKHHTLPHLENLATFSSQEGAQL